MSTGIDFPWLRRIRVEISGLANSKLPALLQATTIAKGNEVSKTFESDGTMQNLRITAKINKQMGISDPAQIIIWNLSADTRNGLQRERTKIKVYAGWDYGPNGGDLRLCFAGTLLNSTSHRAGQDIVTNIYAMSSIDSLAQQTEYKPFRGIPVKDVVLQLARKLEGIKVDPVNIKDVAGTISEKGWAATGSIRQSLERLGRQYGFTCSYNDGKFMACGDDSAFNQTTRIADPYLIDVNPYFGGPMFYENGIGWRCTFEPNLLPLCQVNIKSSISDMAKKYNGTYKISSISHNLDCYSPMGFITQGNAFMLSRKT